jgi:Uncharacterized protein conserved in bacteria C-term(DUF2220)
MSEGHSPEAVHVPLLVGETSGRVEVPLAGLPEGIGAFTIPRKGPDGDRVPRDRRGRTRVREADLVSEGPVEAFLPPAGLSTAELAWVLETGSSRRWQTIEGKFGDRAWPVSLDLIRAGGVVMRCDVSDPRTYQPRSWRLTHAWAAQAADLLREMRGQPVPCVARADLLQLMEGIQGLAAERAFLSAVPADAPLRVPTGSCARTGAWPVYDAAIRAACFWWQRQVPGGRPPTMAEIAGKALGGSHNWTPARKLAFANVIGKPLDEAVDKAEYEICVRGPLRWSVGSVAADALEGKPWIGLPSQGIRLVGRIERNARGVLVVENSDTFKQVCLLPDLTDRWLCVWGKGSVADDIVAFLRTMSDLPIAAWCDLDAYGIQIVSDLARRLERDITPIAMSVHLYVNGTKYSPDDLSDSHRVAKKMALEGIDSLRDLAKEIAASGGLGCEQETLYDEVLPTLAKNLFMLEREK